jgi:hypothetical protein
MHLGYFFVLTIKLIFIFARKTEIFRETEAS